MTEESSTEPPWIHTIGEEPGGPAARPASRQCKADAGGQDDFQAGPILFSR